MRRALMDSITSLSTIAGACPVRCSRDITPSSGTGRPYSVRSPRSCLRPKRATASPNRAGRCSSATAIMSPGIPPGPVRSTMLGGVRADSHTLRAPPSARSCAISMPEQPGPTTSTTLSANGSGVPVFAGVRQLALEQIAPRPVGHDRLRLVPGGDDHLGDADLAGGGVAAPSRRSSARSGRRCVPSWRSIPSSRAWWSRCSTSWSREGNIGVPFAKRRPGRWE